MAELTVLALLRQQQKLADSYQRACDFLVFGPTLLTSSCLSFTYTRQQIDYFITIGDGDMASIMHAYVDAVGHAPMLPEYAAGYVVFTLVCELRHIATCLL